MGVVTLPFAAYLDAFSEELERTLDALEAASPSAAVPTCPGWTATDLAEHLRHVYARWRAHLAAGGDEAPEEGDGEPGAPGTPAAMYEEGTALLAALGAAGPDAACWNWSGADETAAWLARRMALETAVHRVDAERCSGSARPVEAELAADGIDERIAVHLRADLSVPSTASLGGSLCLVCSDRDDAFVVDVTSGRLRWRRGRGPADAALVGTASDLFLFTWNRVPLDALSLTGREDVAAAWATLPT